MICSVEVSIYRFDMNRLDIWSSICVFAMILEVALLRGLDAINNGRNILQGCRPLETGAYGGKRRRWMER